MPTLFVYGTLRGMKEGRFLGEGRVAGRVYDLGEYPGMVLSEEGSYVPGELYEIPAELFGPLDEYEADEYRREIVKVELPTGETVEAWAYVLVLRAEPTR